MIIHIKQEDIDKAIAAVGCPTSRCVMVQALKRTFDTPYVAVGYTFARVLPKDSKLDLMYEGVRYDLSPEAQKITGLRSHDWYKLAPCKVEIMVATHD